MASAARDLDTLQQVGSNRQPKGRGKAKRLPFSQWQGLQIQRNGKIAGRLVVVRPDDWLSNEDNAKLRRKAHALKLCSRQQWVQLLSDGSMELASVVHCHDRLCAMCAAKRSHVWQDRVQNWVMPNGRTRLDANGRLKGNRTADEVMAALNAEVLRLQRTLDDPQALREAVYAAWDRAGREMVMVERQLYQQFVTLTIPNVEHVWMLGIGRDLLDGYILGPFRRMMEAIKRRRNRAASGRVLRVTRGRLRRALWSADMTERRRWQWKRPRGRHYLLGIGYLTRIRGYIASLEITHNPKTGYHPHLHLLTWSTRPYVGQGIVRHVWRHYARNQAITAVKVVKAKPQTVGKELVKYLTKVEKTTTQAVREIERALFGRRAIWSGGIAYGVKWSKQLADEEKMQRLTAGPVAPEGTHVMREWDGVTKEWRERPLRDDGAMLPVRTAEQWANPLRTRLDGEIVRRMFAENEHHRREAARMPGQLERVLPGELVQHRRRQAESRERRRQYQEDTLRQTTEQARKERQDWKISTYLVLLVEALLSEVLGADSWEAATRQLLSLWAA